MIEDINQAVATYNNQWNALLQNVKNKDFFRTLMPTAVGWKVTDRTEYDRLYQELHDQSDRIIETWMNGRWIAKMHLHEPLVNGIEIVKLMQRRPGSSDTVGLDHLDFYSPPLEVTRQALQAEADLKWSEESNDVIAGYNWLSIWFDGTEAKLKHDTVLDIVRVELEEINKKIIDKAA